MLKVPHREQAKTPAPSQKRRHEETGAFSQNGRTFLPEGSSRLIGCFKLVPPTKAEVILGVKDTIIGLLIISHYGPFGEMGNAPISRNNDRGTREIPCSLCGSCFFPRLRRAPNMSIGWVSKSSFGRSQIELALRESVWGAFKRETIVGVPYKT